MVSPIIIQAVIVIFCSSECPDLPDIPNGSVSESGFTTGSIAVYSCDEGFMLMGDLERECMNNSMWSGEAPVCISVAGEK